MATLQVLPVSDNKFNQQNILLWLFLIYQYIFAGITLLLIVALYLDNFAFEDSPFSIDLALYQTIADLVEFPELAITGIIALIQLVFVIGMSFGRLWGYAGLQAILVLIAINMLISFNNLVLFAVVCMSMLLLWLLVKYTDVYLL